MPVSPIPGEYATYLWFTADELADPTSPGRDGIHIDRFNPVYLDPDKVRAIAAAGAARTPRPGRDRAPAPSRAPRAAQRPHRPATDTNQRPARPPRAAKPATNPDQAPARSRRRRGRGGRPAPAAD